MRGPLAGPRDGCATQRKFHSKAAKVKTKFHNKAAKAAKIRKATVRNQRI